MSGLLMVLDMVRKRGFVFNDGGRRVEGKFV